jgi:hypothetical protein
MKHPNANKAISSRSPPTTHKKRQWLMWGPPTRSTIQHAVSSGAQNGESASSPQWVLDEWWQIIRSLILYLSFIENFSLVKSSTFNQQGKRKEKRSKAQRSKILYFIWVIGKVYYQEGCIKKIWWEVGVLNILKHLFSSFTGQVRWIYRISETLDQTYLDSGRLLETFHRLQRDSPDLSNGLTRLV